MISLPVLTVTYGAGEYISLLKKKKGFSCLSLPVQYAFKIMYLIFVTLT